MSDTVALHAQLDQLEADGANWQRLMTAHALVDAGFVTAIECSMPRCIYDSRAFNPKVRSLGLSIDHIIPRSKGGNHHSDNLRIAHHGCNSAAVLYNEERSHVQSVVAKRTRRESRYATRNEELNEQPVVKDDVWLNAWKTRMFTSWEWLKSTRLLQTDVFNIRYELLTGGDELADYIQMNVIALMAETTEFLNEVKWKQWAKDRGAVNRDEAVDELIDIAHFVANLAVVLGVGDVEWQTRYKAKQLKNAERQLTPGGYTGEKCHKCHRELDREGATVVRNGFEVGGVSYIHCTYCNVRLKELPIVEINDTAQCPRCKRALDEVAFSIIYYPNGVEIEKVLCVCGGQLTRDLVEPFLND